MDLKRRKNLLLISLAAESFLVSYGLLIGSQTAIVSVLYLIAGLVFIYSMLILPEAKLPDLMNQRGGNIIKWPVLLVMLLLAFITSRYWLENIPLDPDFADMLPVIKVMNSRFLHGDWKQVYDPIPEIWNGTKPIYLPAMWLPYSLSVYLQTDMRWVTVITVAISFIIILILIRIRRNQYFGYGVLAVGAWLFWWIFARNDVHGLISMSEEGPVILYFVLLTLSIISGNAFLMGIAASLCMLSRYSMIGWLIPCLVFFFVRKDFRKALLFSATGITCFLLFFLFPFGSGVFQQMIALPRNYIAFAKHVWEYTPEVYWLNPGMAKFFGAHHMELLHNTLLVTSFCIPFLFMCFCLFQRNRNLQNINLACFKLSVLVFYQFIDVPFGYLFYTSSFVSLVISAILLGVINSGRAQSADALR